MKRSRQSHRPAFLWQGVLILVPVLALATVGAYALRKDQQTVEREATTRAEELAEQIAAAIWEDLEQFAGYETNLSAGSLSDGGPNHFIIDSFGRLVHPPPYDAVPRPQSLNAAELPDEQRAFWERAQAAFGPGGSTDVPRDSGVEWQTFLASSPPSNFAAVARYSLGSELAKNSRTNEALEQFAILAERYPATTGEAGLPLSVLAGFRALVIERPLAEPRIARVFRRALEVPSAFTPQILQPDSLDRLTTGGLAGPTNDLFRQFWQRVQEQADEQWRDHERLRNLYTAVRPRLSSSATLVLNVRTNGPGPIASLQQPLVPPVLSWVTVREQPRRVEIPIEQAATRDRLPLAAERKPEPLTVLDTPESPQRVPDLPDPVRRTDGAVFFVRSNLRSAPAFVRFDSHWLLRRSEVENGYALHCLPSERVRQLIDEAVQRAGLPQYFDASVRLAEREVISTNSIRALEHIVGGKGGGQFWRRTSAREPLPVLATFTRSAAGEPLLAVAVHLISREMLFEQQRARALSFLLVIGAAIVAAFAGFIGAWRAFRRQLRLAEMKSNFVSSVSHELRAPIASVRLMAEGLERGKISEPSKQQEYFRFIVQECRRLSSMVENVLDFARIEQGRKQYEPEPTDLTALVAQTVKLMQPYAAERDVRLSMVAADVTRLEANCRVPPTADDRSFLTSAATIADIDAAALQQALVNLIDNAIKHSPAGSEVLVELSRAPAPSPATIHHRPFTSCARLSVTDRGPGIPASEHARIFERFHRLGSELRRETPGVGIGLSIVKHIVEAHGGQVFVESEIGQGSRFTMELPLTAEAPRRREGL